MAVFCKFLGDFWEFLEKVYFFSKDRLRYHGRWIFKKNAKNLFFAVQIEKTENKICRKNGEKSFLTFYDKGKNYF